MSNVELPSIEKPAIKKGFVTQKDIARRMGVSHQLVGLALGGHPAVSEETRSKIIELADSLGYDRFSNREARALVSRRYGKRPKSDVIAVLTPGIPKGPLRSFVYYTPFLDGIEDEASERRLDVLLCSTKSRGLPRLIQSREVDGVICMGSDDGTIETLQSLSLPTVNLDRQCKSGYSLIPNNQVGIDLAVRHLIELGHRRIAYVGPVPAGESPKERYDAFRSSMAAQGALDTDLVEATAGGAMTEAGADAMTRLLERTRDFSAVVCYNDAQAMGAVRVAQEHGLAVPQDLSVTGFDDTSVDYQYHPMLTSVRFPRYEMGRIAVRFICGEIGSANEPGSTPKIMDVELMVRESTAAPR